MVKVKLFDFDTETDWVVQTRLYIRWGYEIVVDGDSNTVYAVK